MTNRLHHSLTLIQVGAAQIRLDLTAFEFLINEFFNVEKKEKLEQFFVIKLQMQKWVSQRSRNVRF